MVLAHTPHTNAGLFISTVTASRGLACIFAGQRRALLYDLEEDEDGEDTEME